MTSTRLLFLRHGETDYNLTGRWQGALDVPLNQTGRDQAAQAAKAIAARPIAAVYSSDLSRASETAEIVTASHDWPITFDARLREINVGSWAGKTHDEVLAEYPAVVTDFWQGKDFRRSTTGETVAEMVARSRPAVEEIITTHPGEEILIVAHGMLLSKLIQALIGIDFQQRVLGGLGNAHLAQVRVTDAGRYLEFYNLG